jgi:hypothetical protein
MKDGLICLQYWDGDRDKAMRLARFLADLEPSKREDVDFAFFARADSSFDRRPRGTQVQRSHSQAEDSRGWTSVCVLGYIFFGAGVGAGGPAQGTVEI